MAPTAYPLHWPDHIPRTKNREASRFKTTLASALRNVQSSLAMFGKDSGKAVNGIILSSNVSLGDDRPSDPGIAAWFTWDGMSVCIPVDRYKTPAENLQAIHHIIEARRTELRHGTLALVRATFKGFTALPAPASKRPIPEWWEVLGIEPAKQQTLAASAFRDLVERRYRELAKERHPDVPGGSHEAMAELNRAKEEALI